VARVNLTVSRICRLVSLSSPGLSRYVHVTEMIRLLSHNRFACDSFRAGFGSLFC
jgi:hypothetical protein